jgi:GTP-binding protein
VSDIPGTTRDVVEGVFDYQGTAFRIMDTAGIRRKAKVTENIEYYSVTRAIKTLDDCDVVFLVLDAAERISEQDKKIAALANDRGRGIIFVLNKWDTQEKSFKAVSQDLQIMFGHMAWAPIIPISAKNGTGLGDLLKMAIQLHSELYTKIDTPSLNLALADWLAAYPPPSTAGAARFKLRYLLQTGVAPVSFLLFCNKPDAIPQSYVTYLKNRLKKDLGFDHIPVLLEVRKSRKNWEELQTQR